MATELSRTFDLPASAIHLVIQDLYGHMSNHTIYVAGTSGVDDVNAHVTQLLADVDTSAEQVLTRMKAAGFIPNDSVQTP